MERRVTLQLIEGGRDMPGVLAHERIRADTRLRLTLRRRRSAAPSLLGRLLSPRSL